MVGLDDLHIVVVAEVLGGLLDELEEHSYSDGVVGGDDGGDVVVRHGLGDPGLLFRRESGGSDDEVHAGRGCGRCIDSGGGGDGEVDEDVRLALFEDLRQVLGVGDGDSQGSDADGLSDVLADVDEIECRGELHALGGQNTADEEVAHPSAGSEEPNPDVCRSH